MQRTIRQWWSHVTIDFAGRTQTSTREGRRLRSREGPRVSWLERAGTRWAASRAGGWVYDKICRRVDKVLLPLSRGRLSTGPAQTLLLRTRGARSGRPRSVPLAFVTRGDDLVLIGSKGGHPQHPAWVHNLRAHPEATVEIRGRRETVLAREAEGAEREELWRVAVGFYPGYAAYQERAGSRRIPVMILSRMPPRP
jgi:deazaflavin-dependent oxidoreductase (nitroreductase family)